MVTLLAAEISGGKQLKAIIGACNHRVKKGLRVTKLPERGTGGSASAAGGASAKTVGSAHDGAAVGVSFE